MVRPSVPLERRSRRLTGARGASRGGSSLTDASLAPAAALPADELLRDPTDDGGGVAGDRPDHHLPPLPSAASAVAGPPTGVNQGRRSQPIRHQRPTGTAGDDDAGGGHLRHVALRQLPELAAHPSHHLL